MAVLRFRLRAGAAMCCWCRPAHEGTQGYIRSRRAGGAATYPYILCYTQQVAFHKPDAE